MREEAPNKLTISNQNRWGAPLPDMTQRVLSQNLMLRLPAGKVILPQQPAPASTGSISVDILQFGVDASGTVVLDGSWSLVPSGTEVAAANYRFHLSQRAIAGDYADQARVMSTLLGQLADSIVHELHTRGRRVERLAQGSRALPYKGERLVLPARVILSASFSRRL